MVTRHPPNIILPGTSDRLRTPALDESLTAVQYKRAVINQLNYSMEAAGHKQIAAQKSYEGDLDRKIR